MLITKQKKKNVKYMYYYSLDTNTENIKNNSDIGN